MKCFIPRLKKKAFIKHFEIMISCIHIYFLNSKLIIIVILYLHNSCLRATIIIYQGIDSQLQINLRSCTYNINNLRGSPGGGGRGGEVTMTVDTGRYF